MLPAGFDLALAGQGFAMDGAPPGPISAPGSQDAARAANPSPAGAVGEVIVTALKRTERLEDVPATAVVTPGLALQQAGVTGTQELGQVVPGIQIQAPSPGLFAASVRGLSSSPSNNSFEQTVGLFIDGVFAGHPRDYLAAIFDVDSVELLKGTQAAVLGKNTSVGAVVLNTRKPGQTFGYDLAYRHEFELGSDVLNAAVDAPLSDTLSVRIAGILADEGGWVRNPVVDADWPDTRTVGGRISLRWRPNSNLDWTVSGQLTSQRVKGQDIFIGGDTRGNLAAVNALYGGGPFLTGWNLTSATPRPDFVFDGKMGSGPYDDESAQRETSTLNYYLGDYTLTSISGYSAYDDWYLVNFSAIPKSPFLRAQHEWDRAFSQELRISSPSKGKLTYIGGIYYYNDVWGVDQISNTLSGPGISSNGSESNYYKQKTDSISAFGQGTLEIIDKLYLIAGIRYDYMNKSGYFSRDVLVSGGTTRTLPPYAPQELSLHDDNVAYSIQLKYNITPELMAYAGYFTGYTGPGFQSIPTTPATAAYKSETSKTTEVGAKWTLPIGGYLNASLFRTDIDNFQFAFNTGVIFIVRNDFVRSQGADLELTVPLGEKLSFSQNLTYADVTKTRPVAGAIKGVPWAPRWSGISDLTFKQDVGEHLRAVVDANVQFRSREYLNDSLTFPVRYSDGFAKFNLRIALQDTKKGLEFALVGRNLTDEKVVNYAVPLPVAGAFYYVSDPPRTIAVEVSAHY